jgi:hypothetical protein
MSHNAPYNPADIGGVTRAARQNREVALDLSWTVMDAVEGNGAPIVNQGLRSVEDKLGLPPIEADPGQGDDQPSKGGGS